MPRIIEYIDAIARKKQRDVLFLQFRPENFGKALFEYDYDKDKRRKKVISWLKKNNIPFQNCAPEASSWYSCYLGDIYIDIPFDESDPQYQHLRDYLENPDGTMRDESIHFYILPLERAMKNAHHDEPGFWDREVEGFEA